MATTTTTHSSSSSLLLSKYIPDLVPKQETHALQFVEDYPTYDGRNVVLGVLDTGVDPSLTPLNQNGKLSNCEDCSGSGDVLLSTISMATLKEEKEEDPTTTDTDKDTTTFRTTYWHVTGLSGRTLNLPYHWNLQPFPSSLSSSATKEDEAVAVVAAPAAEETKVDENLQDEATAATTVTTTVTTVPVRLGIKRAYELFPRTVVRRCKEHRKRQMEPIVHQYIAKVRMELAQLQTKLQSSPPEATTSSTTSTESSSSTTTSSSPAKKNNKKKQQEELEARLQILNTFWEEYDDPGPVYDIVVFWDGNTLRAVVDVTETGHVQHLPTMTDYDKEHQVSVFGIVDQVQYGIHFYNPPNEQQQQQQLVLNFFCDATSHGSHVANIATAASVHNNTDDNALSTFPSPSPQKTSETENDPDIVVIPQDKVGTTITSQQHQPQTTDSTMVSSNLGKGVAPGARLVSLKIGDTRMGGMETGTSLMRALISAVRHQCHVLNISYGEGTRMPNVGRIIHMMEEVVWRHNIIIVSSAGNNGPAMSCLNAPGGASAAIIGIAASVSTNMMKANYSMMVRGNTTTYTTSSDDDAYDNGMSPVDEEVVDTPFTWTSVGPLADGDWGVTVTAPGGATTRVASWTLQKTILMHGTSMSSPHAAGCVALLLSACIAEGIPHSSARIKRALINTAEPLPNVSPLRQGAGVIQVDRAWQYLKDHRHAVGEDVHFDVRVSGSSSHFSTFGYNSNRKPRGIYLRQPDETMVRQQFAILIDPQFLRKDVADLDTAEQERRIDFEMNFIMESTEPSWVQAPKQFHLVNNSRSFVIQVDPIDLEPGVHTASVRAMDASCPDRGAIFFVPITVVKTLPPTNSETPHIYNLGPIEFEPAEIKRYFLQPPIGATWMDVTIRDCRDIQITKESTSRLIVLHTVQLLPNYAWRDHEVQKYLTLIPGQTSVTTVAVEGGVTVEIAIGRFWSTLGKTEMEVSVEFHGIRPVPDHIHIRSGEMGVGVTLHSDFRDEWIRPTAKLSVWSTPLRPKTEGIISPVSASNELRDVVPAQKKQIYQLVLSYEFTQDEKGSFVPRVPALQGILYESAYESQLLLIFDGDKKYLGVADAYPDKITAPKGPVTVRLQVRHDDPSMLEKLKDVTIWIERQLDKEIDLSVFGSRYDLQIGKPSITSKYLLQKGRMTGVVFAEPPSSKLPSNCKIGDVFQGKAFFGSGDSQLPGEGKRPNGFPVSYLVGPKMEQSAGDSVDTPEPKDDRTLEQRLNEAVRDIKLEQLNKLTQKEKDDGKFDELFGQLETEYPDHIPLYMAKLKHLDTNGDKSPQQLSQIVEAADAVIGKISEDELALHFGKLHDKENPEEAKKHKAMEQKKALLVEAMARKAFALLEMKGDDNTTTTLDELFSKLQEWVDLSANGKLSSLCLEKEIRDGRYGCALKMINKLLSSDKNENGVIHPMTKSSMYLKRAEIYESLGYRALAEHDEKVRLISCPKDYNPF